VQEYVLWYQELGMQDVPRVGGKNASLGEMISNLANAGVQVPGGFATTADAFNEFLDQSGLNAKIHDILDSLDVTNTTSSKPDSVSILNMTPEADLSERTIRWIPADKATPRWS